mmetsp:Transcript_22529/g.52533  ORF Transcript_22529/g.52533 Transcript_22529/m.52533 type:complete len:83 (-) Transcript_22529:4-252(-)
MDRTSCTFFLVQCEGEKQFGVARQGLLLTTGFHNVYGQDSRCLASSVCILWDIIIVSCRAATTQLSLEHILKPRPFFKKKGH